MKLLKKAYGILECIKHKGEIIMKEYQIEVTSVTVVYVEADNEDEAVREACASAFNNCPDIYNAEIINVTDLED